MVKFDGTILQFGFGAVGKSFYEKVSLEIKFNEYNYYVISKYEEDFKVFLAMGGIAKNFIHSTINSDNFSSIFKEYLKEGDLLIDFSDTVGTSEICNWCANENIMYINTGDANWSEEWPNIFKQSKVIDGIKKEHQNNSKTNQHPIVLQHGNNPGLVSHFVKAGIEYIVKTQYKKNKKLHALIKENKWNLAAQELGIDTIHVSDIDTQKIKQKEYSDTLYSTWCIDSFFFEMISEGAISIGVHEKLENKEKYKLFDLQKGILEFSQLACEIKCTSFYPAGSFEGFLVPHEETITIGKSLEVKEGENIIYRPSVMFVYSPCEAARLYMESSKVNDYPTPDLTKPLDIESEALSIYRGYKYPMKAVIPYKEDIILGTEYVGVLIMGADFDPVWVGNRIEPEFLYKKGQKSYWQTPTITPVAISALSAVSWMLKNKGTKGIFMPEEIPEYKPILKTAEKYISKTIYKTFPKEDFEKEINIDFSHLSAIDFIKKTTL